MVRRALIVPREWGPLAHHITMAPTARSHGADAQIRTLQDKTPAQEAVSQTLSLVTRGPAAAHCLATAWC